AGNGNTGGKAQPACNYSPSRVASAITVSATDNTDRKASYANYGTCVDIFAPGNSILSAWYTGDTAGATISGTSMASPHVAGVAALYLQSNTTASPATVASALTSGATLNKVINAGTGSPNRLLFTAY
ncbi:MAG TPA: S8 family serine peptidase, partial [Longimicrobium sp.]|nr:S8 family serine peptidase [Longimicrobium sp.]